MKRTFTSYLFVISILSALSLGLLSARSVYAAALYFTDMNQHTINRMNLANNAVTTVLTGSAGSDSTVSYPQNIAIDPVNKKLLWANDAEMPGTVNTTRLKFVKADANGANIVVLSTLGSIQPPSGTNGVVTGTIEPDPANSKVYWGTTNAWVTQPIQKANLADGSGATNIVTGDNITTIKLDVPGNKIYWATGYGTTNFSSLRRANLDGTGNTTLVNDDYNSHIYWGLGLDTGNNRIYFTDYMANAIYRVNLDGSNRVTVATGGWSGYPYDVTLDTAHQIVYFDTDTTIAKMNYDGTGISTLATVAGSYMSGIAYYTFPSAPTSSAGTSITATGFSANWSAASGAGGYLLDVSTNSGFSSFVTGYNGKDVGNVTTAAVSGLTGNTTYYYRVRAYDSIDPYGGANSSPITVTTPSPNSAPTDISLSAGAINENVAGNSTVGTLSTTDPDAGDTFTYTLVSGTDSTDNASFNISGNSLRITNSPDYESKGSYSVRVRSADQGGLTFEKAFTVTINNLNEAPTLPTNTGLTVGEDSGATTITTSHLAASDPEQGAAALLFTLSGVPSYGTLKKNTTVLAASDTFTQDDLGANAIIFTPGANVNGADSFGFTVSDGQGGSVGPAIFSLTVTAVNDVPSFTKGGNQTVGEDSGAQTVNGWATGLSKGPVNESGQVLSFNVNNDNNSLFSAQPAVDGVGNLTYTPAANAFGSATVTVAVHDDGGTANGGVDTSADQTFTITVTGVNDAPVATDDSFSTNEDNALVDNVLTNDTDVDGDGLTASKVSDPVHGSLALNADGSFTYTPAADYSGPDSFTYRANDGMADSNVATVNLTVNASNDVPAFTKGGDQTVLEDPGAQTVNNWATAISKGPADESAQTLNFIVTNDNNGLFTTQPAVSAAGALTYTPAANINGSATVTVSLHDNGGTANGGVDTSGSQTFTITVTAVNDPPSFTKGADQTVAEESGAQTVNGWATGIAKGPADEAGQTVDFLVSNDNNGLFAVQPAVSSAGTLTYTPAANSAGSATVTVALHDNGGGADTSAGQTFTITVTGINDVPSFTKGGDQTVLEDGGAQTVNNWATGISVGPADESAQTLDFIVSNNNNGLFSSQPAISATGTLTYTPAASVNGSATVTVAVHDNGGTANGGVNTSAVQTFTITVTAVNDVPSFTKGADQTVLEDAGGQTVNGWATGIAKGPADEAAQTVNFLVSNDNNSLFSVQPAVSSAGTLTYTPATNTAGTATVTVALHDSGGTADGGVDTSTGQTLTITVTGINDVPAFTKGADQSVLEDCGLQTVTGWATGISKGPADEAGQTVNFIVVNDNNALFAVQPAVSADGTLTFAPTADLLGESTVTVRIHDNGGTANGGSDTSATQTFTIHIDGLNDAPSFTKGADQTVLEDAGPQTVANWATAISPGPPNEPQQVDFIVTNDNNALFSVQPEVWNVGWLVYTPAANANGTATVTVKIHDNGGTYLGGVDTSAPQTFTITVTAVNDPPAFTGTPAIIGTAVQGQTLGLSNTEAKDLADGDSVSLSYQWRADGGDISGATGSTYKLTAVEADKTVTCAVTGNDGQGQANSSVTVVTGGVLAQGDADGDGVGDHSDNCPNVSNANQVDANGDGVGDVCDFVSDSDNDGASDGQELSDGTNPLVSDNGSLNPQGDYHSGLLLDAAVSVAGSQLSRRQDLSFNGTVVGSYQVVASSDGVTGQSGTVRYLPNPDHTFNLADSDFSGITANDGSVEVVADTKGGDNSLALQLNGLKGTGLGNGALTGNYVFSGMYDLSASTTPSIVTRRLALSFNGSGSVSFSTLADSDGGNLSGSAAYSVSADGTLDLLGGSGFVATDSELIMAADTTVDVDPQVDDEIFLGVGVRKGSNLAVGSLRGQFVYYEMGFELHTWTARYFYTFDGAGGGTYSVSDDSDGQTTATPVSFSYTVDASGNVSIGGQLVGVMSARGEYLLFTDADWNDAAPGILMGIGVKTAHPVADQLSVVRRSDWYQDVNDNGVWDGSPLDRLSSGFAQLNWLALVGDWNGDGRSDLGIYQSGTWRLDLNGNGIWEPGKDKRIDGFNQRGDLPVVGDWNGDGITEIGSYKAGRWCLDLNGNGRWDGPGVDKLIERFGQSSDVPVVGDWNGDGISEVGLFRSGLWLLDINNDGVWDSTNDRQFSFGQAGDIPVTGDWSGGGADGLGVFRQGNWYLDLNNNGVWEGTELDRQVKFGISGDTPLVGYW